MKKFNFLVAMLFFVLVSFCEVFYIDQSVFDSEKLDFISHTGNGFYSNYLTMEIPFEPVRSVLNQLKAKTEKKLKNRGEAHITVLTPVEYNEIKKYIDMNEINSIAIECDIQNSRFGILGIGKGEIKDKKQGVMQTYFIVVESYNLLNIRVKILKKIMQNGGDISVFDPYDFYPHITLGFTHRDLHIQDGVVKDEGSVFEKIEVIK